MDLDFHGLSSLSVYFIERFIEQSDDRSMLQLLDFYKCYRAYVRGKINLFTAADPAVDAAVKSSCTNIAGRYFELADSYVE
jgi:aminoglycoside phosphotransferase family enzyme